MMSELIAKSSYELHIECIISSPYFAEAPIVSRHLFKADQASSRECLENEGQALAAFLSDKLPPKTLESMAIHLTSWHYRHRLSPGEGSL